MPQENKPFSIDFVVRTTVKHMKRDIDLSIRKTQARIPEFADTPQSVEVFETLAKLQYLRNQVEHFQNEHPKYFQGNK